ncbi:hypothetical protein [Streptomyces sp. NPDC058086]|uniref:hypothetical protein n=1 Tax=Streptomyces sp. NPDC058086 TaxID=3346334 RepID=UPI0036E96D04
MHMHVYRPASLPANPPVVVGLHVCTQSAQVYADNSGPPQLVDRDKVLLDGAGAVRRQIVAAMVPCRTLQDLPSGTRPTSHQQSRISAQSTPRH